MGAQNSFTCDKCGYKVITSGLWEFYRDEGGNRRPYGHPLPESREAEERGVWGLSGELYCPECDKVFDIIMVEFKEPVHDSMSVWTRGWEPKEGYEGDSHLSCPGCGGDFLVLDPAQGLVLSCPRCEEGRLVGKEDWVS